ncbi:MAG: TVP38/TMEM64 family protein, partial [Lacticaseibacillus paracasei]
MTNSRKVLRLIQLSGLVAIFLFGITCYRLGYLTDPASLQATILQAGIWAPLLFILLQIIHVIFPVIPGGLSTVA